jgi:transposase-like protein
MEENPSTADRWRKAFFRLYELEFRDFHLPLLYAPTEGVRTCNVLATVLLVKPWKLKYQQCMEDIRNRCRMIIRAWSESLENVENDFSYHQTFETNTNPSSIGIRVLRISALDG